MDENRAFREALGWLYGLTDLERQPMTRGMQAAMTLARPAALLDLLGRPDDRYVSILIAGSKGKGSTAAFLASILQAAGHRTGFYSKPHLHTYRERIRVNGRLISKADFAESVARVKPLAQQLASPRSQLGECTTFEVTTALALDYFARAEIQVAVIEVGLGGRLDATNVVQPALAVITPISMEHTAVLGSTLAEIAGEKAGIIKPKCPVLIAPQPQEALEVLLRVAGARSAPSGLGGRDWRLQGDHANLEVVADAARDELWPRPWRESGLFVPLLGAHQLDNVATAVAAAHLLDHRCGLTVAPGAIKDGVARTRWPGRLEVVQNGQGKEPPIVVDGAHNGESAERLWEGLRDHFQFDRLFLVLAVYVDKDLAAIAAPFRDRIEHIWTAQTRQPRCRPAADVASELIALGFRATAAGVTATALRAAGRAAGPRDLICVTGSLSVVAEAREALGLVDETERDG